MTMANRISLPSSSSIRGRRQGWMGAHPNTRTAIYKVLSKRVSYALMVVYEDLPKPRRRPVHPCIFQRRGRPDRSSVHVGGEVEYRHGLPARFDACSAE